MNIETADGLTHPTFLQLCLLGADSFFKQRLFFYDFVLCQDLSLVLYYDFWTGPGRAVSIETIFLHEKLFSFNEKNILVASLEVDRSIVRESLICLINNWLKSRQSSFLARNNDLPPDPRPVVG